MAVTPGATISIRNEATQSTAISQSNNDGSFVLTGLEVGSYTVTISKTGFQTFKETELVLHLRRFSRPAPSTRFR